MNLREAQETLQDVLWSADKWHENSVDDLCAQMGVNRNMIRRWVLKGYVPPGSIPALAAALGLRSGDVQKLKQLYIAARTRFAQQEVAGI